MQHHCPNCDRQLRRVDKRYLAGALIRDKMPLAHSILHAFECGTKWGCGHKFMIRVDKPEDNQLGDVITLFYDWNTWKQAMKTRPGVAQMGTTVGEYTNFIHRDTSVICFQLLKRLRMPTVQKSLIA